MMKKFILEKISRIRVASAYRYVRQLNDQLQERLYRIVVYLWRRLPLSQAAKYRLKKAFSLSQFTRGSDYKKRRCFAQDALMEDKVNVKVAYRKYKPFVSNDVRLIAFYLPQFHPIAENDAWWGKGFTEWTNVKPAQPQFPQHNQPRVPSDLGYYDLRDSNVQKQQINLAKNYGVSGFCFYFYWFKGKRLLETPVLNYKNDPSLDLPFCLCWANENWSRRWDGRDKELLIVQDHSSEDDLAFIEYISTYLHDPRYIKIDGRPLLIVYRPGLLPSARKTTRRWRRWCRQHGIGEIYLAYTQSFETVDPKKYGFDAAIEFPPNNSNQPDITEQIPGLNPVFSGRIFDWRVFLKRSENYQRRSYQIFRSVNPGWDNTARRKSAANIFVNDSPGGYQKWLIRAIKDMVIHTKKSDERLVFINAWNEWAEGATLEPDQRSGYAYLDATRRAREAVACQTLPISTVNRHILAVVFHCYYYDVFEEGLQRLLALQVDFKLYVTAPKKHEEKLTAMLESTSVHYRLVIVDNHGRDVLPFLKVLPEVVQSGHIVILKLHTKKSLHRPDGDIWRTDMYNKLIDPKNINRILERFLTDDGLGMIIPSGHAIKIQDALDSNYKAVFTLGKWMKIPERKIKRQQFSAGSMFYVRASSILSLLQCGLCAEDFEHEDGQVDGTMAHAVERMFGACMLVDNKKIIQTEMIDDQGM